MTGMNTMVVLGPSLLGGSVARACRDIFPSVRIIAAVRSPEKFKQSGTGKVFDEIVSMENIPAQDTDIFIVATPVAASVLLIKKLLSREDLKENALVIDVGSIKSAIVNSLEGVPGLWRFVPCHPMAGSEKAGFEYSRADLFENATVIISPHGDNREGDLEKITLFWETLGASTVRMDSARHDLAASLTSHMPHLLSSVLVNTIELSNVSAGDLVPLSGKGLRDMSRLAEGSPELWRDISLMNRQNVLAGLKQFRDQLEVLIDIIEKSGKGGDEILAFLKKAQKSKRELL